MNADEARARFAADGVVVFPGFYDVARDIVPVQQAIHDVIGLVMRRHGVDDTRGPFTPERFDDGFLDLVARDRRWGGEVYDAVKQLPAFVRLVADPRMEALFRELRPGSRPGVAAGGYGIRMDLPREDRFRAEWHQEYPSQLRSIDGLVYWSPLVPITPELGPVRFCLGSHHDGPRPVTRRDEGGRAGAYALRLQDEAQVIARYPQVAPLSAPGDLIAVDYLTLHASGFNTGDRCRWSMQFRYFNFADPVGMAYGWQGSFAAGVDFRRIHPELCVDGDSDV